MSSRGDIVDIDVRRYRHEVTYYQCRPRRPIIDGLRWDVSARTREGEALTKIAVHCHVRDEKGARTRRVDSSLRLDAHAHSHRRSAAVVVDGGNRQHSVRRAQGASTWR
jgi:hypothetical protein